MRARTACLMALLLLAGCKSIGKCKSGTLFVTVNLPASIADADQLQVSVSIDGGAPRVTNIAHAPEESGTLEVFFSPYPTGQMVKIDVVAYRAGVAVGTSRTTLPLPEECGTATLAFGTDVDGAAPAACGNGAKDVGESDADCGGACAPCGNGKACTASADCQSKLCNLSKMLCVATSCEDGARGGNETGIDCGGGTCPGCAVGGACGAAADCLNMICNVSKMTCVASTCEDGVLDGTETDVDCGGGCGTKCKSGQSCLSTADCAPPGACDGTKRCIAAQCTNGLKDAANPGANPPVAAETDIDCGGTVCGACVLGKMCLVGSDCASGFCNAVTKVCVASQCQDGVKNGSESDQDCGGSCPARCNVGQMCSGGADCIGGAVCTGAMVCCIPSCGGKVCGGDGCGGSCGPCNNATLPMCNGSGTACICSGSSCAGLGAGFVCNGTSCVCGTGSSENCFDGIDNNCNGMIDCADPQCGPSVAVCVPTAPAGYVYGRLAATGACGGAPAQALYTGVNGGTTCTNCGNCAGFGTCTSNLYSDQQTPSCSTPTQSTTFIGQVVANTNNANGVNCINNAPLKNQITVTTTWSGMCNANGTPQKPPLGLTQQDFCSTSSIGGGCVAGRVCVPVGNTCVKGSGGSCAGFSNVTTRYQNVDDSGRGCTACTGCSVASSGSCGAGVGFVNVYLAGDCTGGGNSVNTNASQCLGNVYASAKAVAFSGVTPTCSGTPTSSVTGSATLTNPITVCCN